MRYELPARFEQTIGQFRASQLKISTDFELAVLTEGSISCRKGCSHCCYYPVLTSTLEALVVYRSLVRKRLWTSKLRAHFEQSSDHVRGLSLEVWILSHIPCVLLDETSGTCKSYESRPFSCRTVYARGDPHLCDPSHSQGLPPVLSRKEVVVEMAEMETRLINRHRLGRIILPLPSAVLLAEKLDRGEADFAAVGFLVWKDYIQRW